MNANGSSIMIKVVKVTKEKLTKRKNDRRIQKVKIEADTRSKRKVIHLCWSKQQIRQNGKDTRIN